MSKGILKRLIGILNSTCRYFETLGIMNVGILNLGILKPSRYLLAKLGTSVGSAPQ